MPEGQRCRALHAKKWLIRGSFVIDFITTLVVNKSMSLIVRTVVLSRIASPAARRDGTCDGNVAPLFGALALAVWC